MNSKTVWNVSQSAEIVWKVPHSFPLNPQHLFYLHKLTSEPRQKWNHFIENHSYEIFNYQQNINDHYIPSR